MRNALLWSRVVLPRVLLIPVPLLLIACGDSAVPADDGAAASEAEEAVAENPYLNAEDLCALVPLSEVAAAAGGIEPLSSEADAGPPAACRYLFSVPEGTGSRQMSASLQMLDGFGLERSGAGANAIDVTGIGDEAWARLHTDSYLLYVRRGGLVFSINTAGGSDASWPDMTRAMADVVLDNL